VVHGAWSCGGPLVVFAAGRELPDKQAFRATLAVLWLALNLILLASLRPSARSLVESLAVIPVALAAWAAGELGVARVSERRFRALGAALLGVAGLALMVRGG